MKKIVLIVFVISLVLFNYIDMLCLLYATTGLYCPGCGITRMIRSMMKLDFYQAFRFNQLAFIMSPLILFLIAYEFYIIFLNKKNNLIKKVPKELLYFILIITILFGILRNTRYFSWLKPTVI